MGSRVIHSDEEDARLVQAYRRGDPQAFGQLVVRYQKPVYNAAYRLLGTAEDASDVTQSVFLRIVERLDDYDPQYRLFSWIYRIAVNESIDVLRRSGREEPLDDDPDFESPGADPQSQYESRNAAQRVQRALMAMKVEDRTVLTLRHFAECSYGEIATILELDEKTVKSRLFEARRRLAGTLEDLRGVYS
ncbi:MAG TPA: sigma-70 family RNA polymerase sigma factor [Ramlibacter sp.]|jgi:RNA polymerase sigma-70 factor (ECF subfamily)